MTDHNEQLLDEGLHRENRLIRKDLLPSWIKFFMWIFLVFGVINVFGLLLNFIGISIELGLYGIETYSGFGYLSLLVQALFLLKGAVAFGMWKEKDWAIKLAMIDGIIGVVVCLTSIILVAIEGSLTFRIEIIVLIPYIMKMYLIKDHWAKAVPS